MWIVITDKLTDTPHNGKIMALSVIALKPYFCGMKQSGIGYSKSGFRDQWQLAGQILVGRFHIIHWGNVLQPMPTSSAYAIDW